MNDLRRLLVAGALASASLLATTAVMGQPVTLRFNRWVPATHHFHARILTTWAQDVERVTQGRVKIEFTAASLGAPARQFDLAVTGVADVTAGNQAYTPERFVASRVAELPFLGDSAEALSVAQWRVHEKFLQKADEYKGTKLLGLFNNGASEIFTTARPINSVSDLKNLKIRGTAGTGTEVAAALEVVQVSGPITEAYEMLSRGIADGAFAVPDSVRSFQLDRSLKYQTHVPQGLYNAAFFLVMNEARWKGLAKDIQDAIAGVSGEHLAREAGRVWDDQNRIANEHFIANGMKIATISETALADVRGRLAGIEVNWVKQVNERGIDGKAALEMLRAEAAAYRKP